MKNRDLLPNLNNTVRKSVDISCLNMLIKTNSRPEPWAGVRSIILTFLKSDIRFIWTLHSRISGEAAVDGENNAGYEAGLALVAEEQQSTRQILRHAEATQRSVGDYLVRARGERAVLVEE